MRIALEWVAKSSDHDDIDAYMSKHRFDTNIAELETYFNSVIDWISGVFTDVESEMRGLEWGRLFEAYHTTPYDPAAVSAKVHELYADGAVKKRAGIFEYILGGCTAPDCLKFVCLKKVQRRPFTRSKQTQPKNVANRTARFARWEPIIMRSVFTSFQKWTLTMLPHGAMAAQPIFQTVKCFVRPITGPRAINNSRSSPIIV